MKEWPRWAGPYYAGLLDGEGCVSYNKYPTGIGFKVSFKMCSDAAMLDLAAFYGVNVVKVTDPRPNHRMCYQVSLCGVQAKDFLRRVRPYLKVKAAQANAVLGCNLRSKKARREVADLLHVLNRRGTHTVVPKAVEAA